MKSFYNKSTGVTLTPKNKWVEEQLEADTRFEVAGAKGSKNSGKKEDTNENKNNQNKKIEDYTKKELVALLNENGIEANEDMKKEDLLALVPAIEK